MSSRSCRSPRVRARKRRAQMSAEYPHGECECRHPSCSCGGGRKPGPAAFEVTREGKPIKVCTRCDLSGDRPSRVLLVQERDEMGPYIDWDALGAMCITFEAADRRKAAQQ